MDARGGLGQAVFKEEKEWTDAEPEKLVQYFAIVL